MLKLWALQGKYSNKPMHRRGGKILPIVKSACVFLNLHAYSDVSIFSYCKLGFLVNLHAYSAVSNFPYLNLHFNIYFHSFSVLEIVLPTIEEVVKGQSLSQFLMHLRRLLLPMIAQQRTQEAKNVLRRSAQEAKRSCEPCCLGWCTTTCYFVEHYAYMRTLLFSWWCW